VTCPIRLGLKQADALVPLLFSFALQYAIWRVQVNQDGSVLNGTCQLLVYIDDVNILGGNVHSIKKNTQALVVASKKSGLKVNADKTKYMVMSQDQDAGGSYSVKTDNSFFLVEEFRYLGSTLMNQNSVQEEIKTTKKSGNACCHSEQNLLSSSVLSKNLMIEIYRTVILPVVVYGCETWLLTSREERRLRVLEGRVLRRIFGPMRDEVTGEWETYIMRSLIICTPHPLLFR